MQPLGWTVERVDALKHLWAAGGLSCSQIAAALGGITRNAVIGKVHRMGLTGRGPATRYTYQPRHRAEIIPDAPPPVLKSLIDLRPSACKWPYGRDPVQFGCPCQKIEGEPYCAYHCEIAYQPRERRRRAA